MNRRQSSHADDHARWVERAQEIKARVPIEEVIGAVVSLKGSGKNRTGRCPFHDDASPSFVVQTEKKFFHCFGCTANGDLIKFVMLKQGLGFREAVELLESRHGIARIVATPARPPAAPKVAQVGDRDKLETAHRIWDAAVALTPDCPVVAWLTQRCVVRPALYGVGDSAINDGWPVDLRWLPSCWHEYEKRRWPALIAAIRAHDGTLLTVQRIYLDRRPDGSWGYPPIDKEKLVVGSFGPGTIPLGPPADRMCGGEGVVTTLSAMQVFRRSGFAYVTSGRMKSIEPPFVCSDFIVAADKGGKGKWGEKFAAEGARAFGTIRRMRAAIPRIDAEKGDYNDMVREMERAEPGHWSRAFVSEGVAA